MFDTRTLRRPAYRLYQLAWAGLDWIYPPYCGGCGKPGARWCPSCEESLQLITSPLCRVCGDELQLGEICSNCATSLPPYIALRSWAVYEGALRKAIHRLKYKGDVSLGESLSRPLLQLLQSMQWEIDLIVPVPIGRLRQRQRGYNQAAFLSYPLALNCCKPYRPKALLKVSEIPSQVGLNHAQRIANVAQAFAAECSYVEGRNVLVVDDVTTTGATMTACARALLAAGAQRVFGITLARAGLAQHSIEENGNVL